MWRVNPTIWWTTHAKERAERRLGCIPETPTSVIYRMANVMRVGGTFKVIKDGVVIVCQKKSGGIAILTAYPSTGRSERYNRIGSKNDSRIHRCPDRDE